MAEPKRVKTALIVDDSRLAQAVLSRLLAEHGVAADTAPSAEAALDYLKMRRPDVVFLDHMMPGMDGFEALEAIKANPVMATIPVMMYTSQEGALYVSRARAMGALGVLPKNLQPAEMTNVLRSLHLIPGEGQGAKRNGTASAAMASDDTRRLTALIKELFYEQTATLRDELRRQVKLAASVSPPALPPALEPEPAPHPSAWKRLKPHALEVAVVVLLALAATLGYFYQKQAALLREANQRSVQLAANATTLAAANQRAFDSLQTSDSEGRDLLDVLQWAANRGGGFAFDAVPLDEERARGFALLFDNLERIGFTGTVAIDVHMGRYCMDYGADGRLQLAPPGEPVPECAQLGWPDLEAVALGKRQSVPFANAVAAAERHGQLRVETISHGSAEPQVNYPPASYDVSAGEWNAIASRNQRVGVRLIPGAGSAASE
jgi:CheY-like chemotaxis protein